MTFIQRRINVDERHDVYTTAHLRRCNVMPFIQHRINADVTSRRLYKIVAFTSMKVMPFMQRRINVDVSAWRSIEVYATTHDVA